MPIQSDGPFFLEPSIEFFGNILRMDGIPRGHDETTRAGKVGQGKVQVCELIRKPHRLLGGKVVRFNPQQRQIGMKETVTRLGQVFRFATW